MTRLPAIFLLLSLPVVAQRKENKTLTVCDVLEHLQRYRGKEIAVRGELRTGPEEAAVYGTNCNRNFMTDWHVWPNALWLIPAGSRLAEEPVTLKLDHQVIRAMNEKIDQERASGKVGAVTMTIVGKLEAKRRYFGGPAASGSWVGNGYGHLNAYPAQIVFRKVDQLEVADR